MKNDSTLGSADDVTIDQRPGSGLERLFWEGEREREREREGEGGRKGEGWVSLREVTGPLEILATRSTWMEDGVRHRLARSEFATTGHGSSNGVVGGLVGAGPLQVSRIGGIVVVVEDTFGDGRRTDDAGRGPHRHRGAILPLPHQSSGTTGLAEATIKSNLFGSGRRRRQKIGWRPPCRGGGRKGRGR